MLRSLLSLKATAAPCQDVLWGLGRIQQCPDGDFKDLSPFPPKLLLTQDPGQMSCRYSYLCSPFAILFTCGYSAAPSNPVQCFAVCS